MDGDDHANDERYNTAPEGRGEIERIRHKFGDEVEQKISQT